MQQETKANNSKYADMLYANEFIHPVRGEFTATVEKRIHKHLSLILEETGNDDMDHAGRAMDRQKILMVIAKSGRARDILRPFVKENPPSEPTIHKQEGGPSAYTPHFMAWAWGLFEVTTGHTLRQITKWDGGRLQPIPPAVSFHGHECPAILENADWRILEAGNIEGALGTLDALEDNDPAPELAEALESCLYTLEMILGSDGEDPTGGTGEKSDVVKARAALKKAGVE